MPTYPKYLFDRSFDVEVVAAAKPANAPAAESVPEPEIIVPTFSQEEVDAARQEGFKAGHDQGVREAAEATERKAAAALEALVQRFAKVFARQEEINEAAVRNGVRVADAFVRKLFPDMSRRGALDEVLAVADEVFAIIRNEPKVVIRVSGDLQDRIQERIGAVVAGKGYEGRVDVVGDPAMAAGDCRIDWSGGGAERRCADILAGLDEIIERNLGPEPPATGTDGKGTRT